MDASRCVHSPEDTSMCAPTRPASLRRRHSARVARRAASAYRRSPVSWLNVLNLGPGTCCPPLHRHAFRSPVH
jgi:hypothetical protein